MNKRFALLIIAGLIITLALAACGDTATVVPSTAAVASPTTSAAATTTVGAAAGGMPGMTMQPGQTMPGMSNATAQAGATTGSMAGTDPMVASLQNLTGKDFEIKFMQEMIAHHQGAIDMAKLVPTNTQRPELLQLSQNIIAAQTKEITEQTSWLASWYGAKPLASEMDAPGMMAMMSGMSNLTTAKDAAFDKLFMQMMIPHHQAAVAMANLIPSRTQRPELLKLGQDIVTSQTAEIQQMQGWLKAWFNS